MAIIAANATEGVLQTCKTCQHEFRVPQSAVGREVPCPHCRKVMVLVPPPAAKPEDKLVGREVGGCVLSKRLGAGALGVVYAGEQRGMGRKVAIKMLSSKAAGDPETVARFEREAKLSAQIQHPHVIGVYTCGFERGVHYLVMELVEGGTFAGLIQDHGKLSWQDTFAYGIQIARGLDYIHGRGIIHRDIKPANVLVTLDGQAKLADLGLAKQVDSDAGGMGLTMQGVAMGSPAYMPPEQIRSAKDSTASCDLYALGASLFQSVTGQLPFDGRTPTEVMTKVLREMPPSVRTVSPDIPVGVADYIDRCLSKDPSGRPPSAAAMIEDMEALLKEPNKPRAARKAAGAAAAGGGGLSKGMLIGIIAGVVVIALAVVVLLLRK